MIVITTYITESADGIQIKSASSGLGTEQENAASLFMRDAMVIAFQEFGGVVTKNETTDTALPGN